MSKVPVPPTTLAICLTGQYLLMRQRAVTPTSATVAAVLSLASGSLVVGSLWEFRRQRTSFDPVDVEAATSLVVRGPNRLTRNPMYLGMAGLLAAHAILRRSAVAVLPMAAFVLVMGRVQIPLEEKALKARFGADYGRYRGSVPRW
ncbi:MAG: methyltransferase family protein [Arthrobacter sp.]|uniref:methyltransferase family protein n=1 Tax=unclassified Arthrobacter TaxID=235627 RepID=UPI002653DD67|nr:isoprenylcysteine carboxylmethyltransferase family protein [Micrococcaceae bacterium]MDN5813554.1 isoprenylcysteine carboxylmethyltransferase family protein [Micrococcaceae bacterium]MDN5823089.1 isoprenylcysteine carboxylmethyltransferase family protein [Micrococcaceae bacterium]MDN5880230.1 isoprenylcysteine carboxylmethyltransferase family protein [Micrococcaceae bacterium]MDN5904943.1 isoprenylcysteine carboxylmethyltransferase family protein [Micrococcaceae bacterium]